MNAYFNDSDLEINSFRIDPDDFESLKQEFIHDIQSLKEKNEGIEASLEFYAQCDVCKYNVYDENYRTVFKSVCKTAEDKESIVLIAEKYKQKLPNFKYSIDQVKENTLMTSIPEDNATEDFQNKDQSIENPLIEEDVKDDEDYAKDYVKDTKIEENDENQIEKKASENLFQSQNPLDE